MSKEEKRIQCPVCGRYFTVASQRSCPSKHCGQAFSEDFILRVEKESKQTPAAKPKTSNR